MTLAKNGLRMGRSVGQKDEAVGSDSVTAADLLLRQRRREVADGHHGEKGSTFSQLVDAYFTKVVVNVTPRTVAQYRAWLNH